jgi:hypothetical protein
LSFIFNLSRTNVSDAILTLQLSPQYTKPALLEREILPSRTPQARWPALMQTVGQRQILRGQGAGLFGCGWKKAGNTNSSAAQPPSTNRHLPLFGKSD